jgi:hypothetical protein
MSQPRGRVSGTRSTNRPHERKLVGPHKLLERIEKAGGFSDEALVELGALGGTVAAEQADEQMQALTEAAFESAKTQGAAEIDHRLFFGARLSLGRVPGRAIVLEFV